MDTTDPIVSTTGGDVRGLWRGGSAAFYGIGYAEPPVGALRFAAPVRRGAWEGTRDATHPGPTPQRRPFGEVTAIPEPSYPGDDILNLNVFTPAPGDPDAALPVLVWIHGGGFKAGSPSSPWYDGAAFNRDGVVTVTISYRLGFDGFGWIPDAPHNRGLRDQIAALTWVRENIAAFGGDPRRVTIAGQSAGGGAVWALLASPLAGGLFSAAIVQSGGLDVAPRATAEAASRALADRLGVPWTRDALAAVDEDAVLDATDALTTPPPTDTLDAALAGLLGDGLRGGLAFRPAIDGEVLTTSIPDALAAGVGADLPLLMGATAHEFTGMGALFAPLVADGSLAEALARTPLAPVAADYLATYGALPGGAASVIGQLVTDLTFRTDMVQWADLRGSGPTWLYDFRLVHPGTGLASHCAELPFVFDCLGADRVTSSSHPEPPQALADAMHGAWVQFVTEHRVDWPTWHPDRTAMVFDTISHAEPDPYALERRVAASV